MHLQSLDIRNFRAFRQATITLPDHGIVLVTGANNSGKSALLSALDVAAGRGPNDAAQHAGHTAPARILARFALSEDDRRAAFSTAEARTQWMLTPTFSEVEAQSTWQGDAWSTSEISTTFPDGDLKVVGWANDDQQHWIADLSHWVSAGDTGGVLPGSSGSGPSSRWLDSAQGLGPIRDPRLRWMSNYFHFATIRPGTERSRAVQATSALDPGGENLAETLLHLHTNDSRRWEDLRDVVRDIVPGVGRIETPTEGAEVRIEFVDANLRTRHNLKDLGTGVEQVLLTAYVGMS